MAWLALTLQLDAAVVDVFTDALLEGGAVSVDLQVAGPLGQTVTALVDEHTDAGALLAAAASAAGIALPNAARAKVGDRDWVRESQAQFAPYAIGTTLWVGPTWIVPPRGVPAVRLDPGLAFGTGSHATTRLVLRYLARSITPSVSVLDYGCGSGVLALAAAKLGAARVDAVDVDTVALDTASDNARANGVSMKPVLPEQLPGATYDFVVANILAQPLIALAPVLAARTAQGGGVALSGILVPQAADVAAAYADYYQMRTAETEDGWALLEGKLR
jgi:ribosomal protein L11 methyltransferase